MAEIPRGLNIAKALIDVDSSTEALRNLGLREPDLNLIRGVSDEISLTELHLLSGLVDDQNRVFESLNRSALASKNLANDFEEVSVPQEYNYTINNKLVSGAIKYSYIDYEEPNVIPLSGITSVSSGTVNASAFVNSLNETQTIEVGDIIRIGGSSSLTEADYKVHSSPAPSATAIKLVQMNGSAYSESLADVSNATFSIVRYWDVKQADISTSRVSSWSPVGVAPQNPDDYITYGAKLSCTGEFLTLTELGLTQQPVESEFDAEQPTHNVQLFINGEFKTFPAMKGIPLKFRVVCSDPGMRVGVESPFLTNDTGNIKIAYKRFDIANQAFDSSSTKESSPNAITNDSFAYGGNTSIYSLNTSNVRESEIQVFYPPGRITYFNMDGLQLSEWPYVVMPKLTSLQLENNQFAVMPDFVKIAPNLRRLIININPLYNGKNFIEELGLDTNAAFDGYDRNNPTDAQKSLIAQAQINRIPTTIEDLRMVNNLRGNISVDFSAFQNLATFHFGRNTYNDTEFGRITNEGESPAMPDAGYRVAFQSSDVTTGGSSAHSIQINNHSFVDDDYVQYWSRVDTGGTMATAPGGLVTSTLATTPPVSKIYRVIVVNANTIRLKNVDGSGITLSSQGTGNFHELVKWDNANNKPFADPNKGIRTYQVQRANYRKLPISVLTSPRLKSLRIQGLLIEENGRYPFDSSSSDESQLQNAIFFDTQLLEEFKLDEANCPVPDLSGNTNMVDLTLFDHDIPDKFTATSLRDISSNKFTGLTSLQTLKFIRIGRGYDHPRTPRGDISDIFKDKQSLIRTELEDVSGLEFVMNDTTFVSSTSPSDLEFFIYKPRTDDDHAPVPNQSASEHSGDFFAVDGSSGRTGAIFDNFQNSLKEITVRTNSFAGGRLVNDDPTNPQNAVYQIQLGQFNNLQSINIGEGHFFGKLPNIDGLGNATFIAFQSTKIPVPVQSMKDKCIYRVEKPPYGNASGFYTNPTLFQTAHSLNQNQAALMRFEYEDMGWSQAQTNQDVIGVSGSSVARTSNVPQVGDYFQYQQMSVNKVASYVPYVIRKLGNTTKAQWQSLGWVANSSTFGTGSDPAVGDRFDGHASNPNTVTHNEVQSGNTYTIRRMYGPWLGTHGGQGEMNTITGVNKSTWFEGETFTSIANAPAGFGFGPFLGNYMSLDPNSSAYTDFGTGVVARYISPTLAEEDMSKIPFDSAGYTGSISQLTGMNSLKQLYLQNNTLGGQFPTLGATSALQNLDLSNNVFNGSVPDLSSCTGLLTINLSNNRFSSYTPGSLDNNTAANVIDLSDNQLTASDAQALFEDLWQNNNSAPRSVQLNLLDQNGLTVTAMQNDPNSESDTSALSRYNSLNGSWSIDIDP